MEIHFRVCWNGNINSIYDLYVPHSLLNDVEDQDDVDENEKRKKNWESFLHLVFASLASPRTTKTVRRIFSQHGSEIDDLDYLIPEELLIASEGEDFIFPKNTQRKRNSKREKDEWITLNVGGQMFSTTRSTLTMDPDSMFASILNDEEWQSEIDANGAYLIDRTPEYFAPILNYLRIGQLIIDERTNPEGVLHEAKYFKVTGIIDYLQQLAESKAREETDLERKDVEMRLMTSTSSGSPRGQGLNFDRVDLSELDFSHSNLQMTSMESANLERCNLDDTQLQEANLAYSNMRGASLRGANMGRANLEKANLKGADFEDRGGHKANLEHANLKDAILEDVNFSGANLRAATLKGASLENANLMRADLAGADLQNANLRGANLNKANLIGANLIGANFDVKTVSSRQ